MKKYTYFYFLTVTGILIFTFYQLYWADIKHTPTGTTKYYAIINGHPIWCDFVKQRKVGSCMDMYDCEDGSSYFCVTDIEMKIDN